jgi:hypothetical protein
MKFVSSGKYSYRTYLICLSSLNILKFFAFITASNYVELPLFCTFHSNCLLLAAAFYFFLVAAAFYVFYSGSGILLVF